MPYSGFLTAALAVTCLTTPAVGDITIDDAYARVSSPIAKSGAAFMMLKNSGDIDDRLISVTSVAAKRVELHTHKDLGDGVMQMTEVEDGFVIPASGGHMLQRGGDHVMFMGLAERWADGDMIPVTFTFENAGEITLKIPVDLTRKPEAGHGHGDGHGD